MVLGIAMMAAMVPTMIGLNQASQNMRDSEDSRKESSRKQRCHLLVNCSVSQGTTAQREQIHNAMVYVGPENRDESRITLEGWEGWLAVRFPGVDEEGVWRLWFDRDDDGAGLKDLGEKGMEVQGLEVVLKRVSAES
ncbi:SnoaL-like domain family protein [Aspergillus niger]|uniref:SnoaL-like domain family protein n=1 Tax=Aspergillus niger TaxID=5061 RepID=A0A505I7T0_ASPNG|nr:SnoaL-like domain family protein [Aspergillus niger]